MTRLTACVFEDAPVQYALAQLYYKGQGIDADPEASFYWYLKSALQNYTPSMFKAGCFLKNGTGVEQSASKALDLFLKAAEKGDLQSCLQVGRMYYYGEGIPKDVNQSFYFRKKAADSGDREALADLAWMYEKGEGTGKNIQKALECYQLVAQSTMSIHAVYGMARMYDLLGNFIKKRLDSMKKLLKKHRKNQVMTMQMRYIVLHSRMKRD